MRRLKGDRCRRTRFTVEQRHFTEKRTRTEHRDLCAVARHLDAALDDHHEMSAHLALLGQELARGELHLRRSVLQDVQLSARALLEEPYTGQQLQPTLLGNAPAHQLLPAPENST